MAHRDKYNDIEYCNGKRAYDKKTAITACNKRFKEDHTILRIYECEYGPHWHLTKQIRGQYRLMPTPRHKKIMYIG